MFAAHRRMNGECNRKWRRNIHLGEELNQLSVFLESLQNIVLNDNQDIWLLDIGKDGMFTVEILEDGLMIRFFLPWITKLDGILTCVGM